MQGGGCRAPRCNRALLRSGALSILLGKMLMSSYEPEETVADASSAFYHPRDLKQVPKASVSQFLYL